MAIDTESKETPMPGIERIDRTSLVPVTHNFLWEHYRDYRNNGSREARELFIALGDNACLGITIAKFVGPCMTLEDRQVKFPVRLPNLGVGQVRRVAFTPQGDREFQKGQHTETALAMGYGGKVVDGTVSFISLSLEPLEGDPRAVMGHGCAEARNPLGVVSLRDVIYDERPEMVFSPPLSVFVLPIL